MKKACCMAVFLFGTGGAVSANAVLFDRGLGMVYDSDQNITWLISCG